MITLRDYSPDQADVLIALGREMHAESPVFCRTRFSEEKLRQSFASFAASKQYFFKIAWDGNTPVGGLIGFAAPMYHSDDLIARELTWFISKERRGSVAALYLIRAFEEWCKRVNAVCVMLGQSTGVDVDRVRGLFEKLGYTIAGFVAVKEA